MGPEIWQLHGPDKIKDGQTVCTHDMKLEIPRQSDRELMNMKCHGMANKAYQKLKQQLL